MKAFIIECMERGVREEKKKWLQGQQESARQEAEATKIAKELDWIDTLKKRARSACQEEKSSQSP